MFLLCFLGVASGQWFIAEGRQMLSFQRSLLGAIINILLNIFLIPKFGVIGAAYATILSYAVAALFFDLIQSETRHMFYMKINAFNFVKLIEGK